jgi:hypothetical protein
VPARRNARFAQAWIRSHVVRFQRGASELEILASFVGRTPGPRGTPRPAAGVLQDGRRPTGASAADQGVRPTRLNCFLLRMKWQEQFGLLDV